MLASIHVQLILVGGKGGNQIPKQTPHSPLPQTFPNLTQSSENAKLSASTPAFPE